MIRAEKVTCLLLIAFSVFIGFESRKYSLGTIDNPGPGFLPLLLGVAMAVMAVALAFVTILLFTALLEITGYMVNIFFLFLILLRPIGRQKWSWSIAISMGATLVTYLLFDKWLMIPLPRGVWLGS
jgi:putative tricarboxylic transport membrane protein